MPNMAAFPHHPIESARAPTFSTSTPVDTIRPDRAELEVIVHDPGVVVCGYEFTDNGVA
jgi:hypothetical protein